MSAPVPTAPTGPGGDTRGETRGESWGETPSGEQRPAGSFWRGLWAVVVLLLTALDALITALLGWAPFTPKLRQIGHVIADEYRAGAHGWTDAEVRTDWIGDN